MIAVFHWDLVIGAAIAATPPTMLAWAALRKSKQTHNLVETEVSPNHGSSMRDSLDRIEQRQANQAGEFLQHITTDAEWKRSHESLHIEP